MNIICGAKVRIKPNEKQRKLLEEHFGQSRFVYNYFLEKRQKDYQENKLNSNYMKDCVTLTKMKKDKPWLYNASCMSHQHALKHLDDGYKAFFKGRSGFPTFKSKKGFQSFSQHSPLIRVKGNRLTLPKFKEGLKFNSQFPPFIRIASATISKTPDGKYYASLNVEREIQPLSPSEAQTGIDLGLTDLAVFSTGKRIKAPKHFRRLQGRLKTAQQHLSRKVKGSKRRAKQRVKVARIHGKITNCRKDTLHKASAFAVKNYGTIAVETLNIEGMRQSRNLALSISDAGWGEFVRQLEYKSKWYGRRLLKVGTFYPSSKACSCCGWKNQGLKLGDRVWTCEGCGEVHDRDLNAARNILSEGIKQSQRQSVITDVERGKTMAGLPSKHLSVKRLATKRQLGDKEEVFAHRQNEGER